MKLSDLTIDNLKEYIIGDNGHTPSLKGSEILKLFNKVGFKDIYKYDEGGMPEGLSRSRYAFKKMQEINGKKEMKTLLEIVFNSDHFKGDTERLEGAITSVNSILQEDGFKFENIDGKYKIIGADLPDEVVVEIHFEDIQKQVIDEIKKAKFTIWVAVAWFTDRTLFDLLKEKKKGGVNVQVVVIDDEINKNSGLKYEDEFETYRRKPEGKYGNIMHHKFCIIDLKTVVHGSYNWSKKAQFNKETVAVNNSKELAEKFALEFIDLKT